MRRDFLIPFALLSMLVGCSGGEPIVQSSHVDERGRPPLPEPAGGSAAEAWSDSEEYRASSGLAEIGAAEGYAARTTGEPGGRGKTIAVLDTPLDLDHLELDGKTFNFRRDDPDFSDPDIAHGTHVAGIAVARRDGEGTHGVAYDADLVGIGVLRSVRQNRKVFLHPFAESPADIAAGIASAAGLRRKYRVRDDQGFPVFEEDEETGLPTVAERASNRAASADILNLSFVATDPHGQVREAMRDAAARGRILVAALGNCGSPYRGSSCRSLGDTDGLGPTALPASYVWNLDGHGIAVGALDATGRGRASFSNTCGEVRHHCLFAPGSRIRSTIPGDEYDDLSGTSMAAPHVSGAAAVVWAAFPNKSGSDIVRRLLETARPLDGREVSPLYGHGALDLAAALMPVGEMAMPLPGGSAIPLTGSSLDLPPGFAAPKGLGLAPVVAYDEQGFPFLNDLIAGFREHDAATTPYLWRWLSEAGRRSSRLSLGSGAALHLVHEDGPSANVARLAPPGDDAGSLGGYLLRLRPAPGVTLALGTLASPIGLSDRVVAGEMDGTLLGDRFSLSPYTVLAGEGAALNIDWQFNADSTLEVLAKNGAGFFGSADADLLSVGLTRFVGDRLVFGTRYGSLREADSRLGIRAEGAFGGLRGSVSDFVGFSAVGHVSDGISFMGSMTRGRTGPGAAGTGSPIRNWSSMRGDAVQLGGAFEGLWLPSDRLVLTAQWPFRIREGRVSMVLPAKEIEDGVVHFQPRTVNLAPRGREKRMQLAYVAELGSGVMASFGGYARVEPDHDPAAGPELGAGVKFRVAF